MSTQPRVGADQERAALPREKLSGRLARRQRFGRRADAKTSTRRADGQAGAGKNEVRFTLMNRTHEVAEPCLRRKKLEVTPSATPLTPFVLPSGSRMLPGPSPLPTSTHGGATAASPHAERPCQPPARGRRASRGAAVPEPPACRCRTNTGFTPVRFWARLERRQLLRKRLRAGRCGDCGALLVQHRLFRAHPDNTSDGNLEKEVGDSRRGAHAAKRGFEIRRSRSTRSLPRRSSAGLLAEGSTCAIRSTKKIRVLPACARTSSPTKRVRPQRCM